MASDDAGKPEQPTSGVPLHTGLTSGADHGSAGRVGHEGLAEKPGDSIGPYKLLSVLGEGGFGVVWLAEQREPIQRRVALKVIKPGMDSRAVIARFEQERQALAVMDHPNVARVLDAGTTARGQPYFVMEYVAGEPITDFCDRNRFTTRQRLEVFISVCEAVQHAHTKGIIHRDIKPTNVLVVGAGAGNTQPTPKVIDFGVAKAITQTLTDKTIFTEQGQILGTPEYMSPEQAEMSASGVDTRSDVYSLGVLLYELLTGVLPFDSRSLRAAGYAEIQRIIREVDPPRPSTRLSTLGDEAASVAERHRTEPRAMSKELRRELEWVPLKALRKDRNERYGSPADLARDVRNYLEGRPLMAGPESAAYRARKFARRNRWALGTSGAVAAALALGLTLAAFSYVRAEREKAEKEKARATAALEREATDRAIRATRSAIRSLDPLQGGSQQERFAQNVLERVKDLDAGEYKDRPEAEADFRADIADALKGHGRSDDALVQADKVFAILQRIHTGDHRALVDSYNQRALTLWDLSRSKESEPLCDRALAMSRRLYPGDHALTADTLNNQGLVMLDLGKTAEAETTIGEALAMYRRLPRGDDDIVARGLNNAAGQLYQVGAYDKAEAMFREALTVMRRSKAGDDADVASALNNRALALRGLKRYDEAEPLFQESLAMCRRLFGENHPRVAQALNNVGFVLQSAGKSAEAEKYFRDALTMNRGLLKGDHQELASGMSNLAFVLVALDRPGEAEPLFADAIAMSERLFPDGHGKTANFMKNRAQCLDRLGRLPEALALAERAAAMALRTLPEGHEWRQKCDTLVAQLKAKSAGAGAAPPPAGEQRTAEAAKAGG